jgi:hypothetical protein
MIRRSLTTPLLAAAFLGGCAGMGTPRPPAPTAEEVVQLAADKVPAAEIIRRMQEADAVYRLRASELAKLRERGVPDEVIDHMQETWLEAVRLEQARLESERYFFAPPFPHHHLIVVPRYHKR